MKILVVDDDASILTLLEQALVISGHHQVTPACSGKSALVAIDRTEAMFDCFLIDIQMPEVDGIQLTRLIRQTPGYERHPIVMLTAMHEKSYLDRAFNAGATDYVSKPFNFKDLEARIFEAQTLCWKNSRSAKRPNEIREITWSRGIAKDIDPDQVIAQGHVDGLIAYGAFDNYVLELARRPHGTAHVIALKIADPTLGQQDLSLEAFCSLLGHVLLSTRTSLPGLISAVSYRGNGTLLCVLEREPGAPTDMLQSEINTLFRARSSRTMASKLRVFLGDPMPLRAESDVDVLELLWLATDSVENRFAAKKAMASIPKRLLNRAQLSEEQNRLERKAYTSVMKDILSDVNDERWSQRLERRIRRTPTG